MMAVKCEIRKTSQQLNTCVEWMRIRPIEWSPSLVLYYFLHSVDKHTADKISCEHTLLRSVLSSDAMTQEWKAHAKLTKGQKLEPNELNEMKWTWNCSMTIN